MNKVDIESLSNTLGIDLSPIDNSNVVSLPSSEYSIESSDDSNNSNHTTNSSYDQELEDDFLVAKNNIIDILDHGKEVLTSAENIAVQTENPKTIEAFASLVNSLTNASEKLLELHSKRKAIIEKNKKDDPQNGNNITNNTIAFVGSPSELRKILKKENETTDI